MLDSTMRPVKDRLLAPLIATPVVRLHPSIISATGLAFSLGAATAAWRHIPLLAVTLWLAGRIADGLDGLVASATGKATDTGGLLDFIFDTIGYAAIPIGLAFGIDNRLGWIATSVLLASFYLNAVSLGYIAALLEKHALGAVATGQPTSAVLPRGLIEGTETIVFFTIALAFPDAATTVWWIMAALVTVTALERVRWAHKKLS